MADVVCFDFDGVICDSAPETALVAWRAGEAFWPGRMGEPPPDLAERFARVRPALHTGFEAIPLLRLAFDGEHDEATILRDFPALRDAFMAREGLTTEALAEAFGTARDRLIAEDPGEWQRVNRFYPGMAALLQAAVARGPVFIITTKGERFVPLLLEPNGVSLPPERIYGLERAQPKPAILRGLLEHPDCRGRTMHFIEDRYDTLQQVIAEPALGAVRLYLADWGYNTAPQREEAAAGERIQVVDVPGLRAALGL